MSHKRALSKNLVNFVAWTLGRDEALKTRGDFLRNYVRRAEGLIKCRLSERQFWDGQEAETLRFADDSIDIRIENLGNNIVGSIQYYERFLCQFILAEGPALLPEAEIVQREPQRGVVFDLEP